MSLTPTSEWINGLMVQFPYKPYPSQKAMVNQILRALQRSQNCILESPTGSGKTLALLCAALSWQQTEYDKFYAEMENEASLQAVPSLNSVSSSNARLPLTSISSAESFSPLSTKSHVHTLSPISASAVNSKDDQLSWSATTPTLPERKKYRRRFISPDDYFDDSAGAEDDDFKPTKRYRKMLSEEQPSKKTLVNESLALNAISKAEKESLKKMDGSSSSGSQSRQPKKTVSKIYYCTRTHKQVAQAVRELKKTVFKEIRMSVLGSRDYACIHPIVSKGPSKNEACRQLVVGDETDDRCVYFHGANHIKTQVGLYNSGITTAWDIEDLIKLGKRIRACPYYAARGLKDEADIVFCPYNYVIDSLVRDSLDISLRDVVLILDEAHNIEDAAREAASWTVTENELHNMANDLEKTQQFHFGYLQEPYSKMAGMVRRLYGYLMKRSEVLAGPSSFEQNSDIITGLEMVMILKSLDIGPENFDTLRRYFSVVKEEDGNPESKVKEKLSSATLMGLNALFTILRYLYKENLKHVEDYKIAIKKTFTYSQKNMSGHNEWKSRRSFSKAWVVSLNFWCLNPALVFADIKNAVRSIVLTSGTLSPFDSFQSELGVPFPIKLEADHVVKSEQVWVRSVSVGPMNGSLNACYQNAETFQFQDEVGAALLQICETVPYGVLCFLPSYSLMDRLMKRWQNTGLLNKLEMIKVTVCEERSSDKESFLKAMDKFFIANEDIDNADHDGTTNGALLIAVCRGKVSEGLDFPDNYARAVVTVGIPFPNVKDLQVDMKRKYNNQFCSSRGLLNGSLWYETQAYRALNQALGRCIRHRDDWGAVILLDDRFSRHQKNTRGLSKWIRQSLLHFSDFGQAMLSLKGFMNSRRLVGKSCQENMKSLPSAVSSHIDLSFFSLSGGGRHEPSNFNSAVGQKEVSVSLSQQSNGISFGSYQNSFKFQSSDRFSTRELPLASTLTSYFFRMSDISSQSNTTQQWTPNNASGKENSVQDCKIPKQSPFSHQTYEMAPETVIPQIQSAKYMHESTQRHSVDSRLLTKLSQPVACSVNKDHVLENASPVPVKSESSVPWMSDVCTLLPFEGCNGDESPPLF